MIIVITAQMSRDWTQVGHWDSSWWVQL